MAINNDMIWHDDMIEGMKTLYSGNYRNSILIGTLKIPIHWQKIEKQFLWLNMLWKNTKKKKLMLVDDSESTNHQILGHHHLETFLFSDWDGLWEPKLE